MNRMFPLLFAMLLVISACSSEDGSSNDAGSGDASAGDSSVAPSDDTSDDGVGDPSDASDAGSTSAGAVGSGTATVSLGNGEVFEFEVLCALEPQIAAGSEILFTVVSYDDPINLDVTQLGADSLGGVANISLYDSTTYDSVWDASSFTGGEVELSLDGSTVSGTGMFVEGEGDASTAVPGELIANC